MKSSIYLFLIFFLSGYFPELVMAQERVLLVADEWPPMHVLAHFLESTAHFEVDTANQEDLRTDLSEFDHMFMYVHKVLQKEVESRLIDYTEKGGNLIVLHHGIASAKLNNPGWLDFVGVDLYPRDSKENAWDVLHDTAHTMVNLAPDHFITSQNISYQKSSYFSSGDWDNQAGNFPCFTLDSTEIFVNQIFNPEKQHVVLFGVAEIQQPTSGWYRKAGKGWLFYYQAGHQISDFENPHFKQVLLNTLEWIHDQSNNRD